MKLKRINSVLVAFFASLLVCFFLFVQTIQSNWFVSILSESVDNYFKKYVSKELTFSTVELQLFPPGVEVGNISSRIKNKGVTANIYAGKLGVYFNIIDFFSRKLSVREVAIKDSVIEVLEAKIKKSEQVHKGKKLTEEEIFTSVKASLNKLPVKLYSVSFYNTKINYVDEYEVSIKKLISKINKNNIILNLDLDSKGKLRKYVDNVSGNIIAYKNKVDVYNLKLSKNSENISFSGEVKDYLSENLKFNVNVNGQVFLPHVHNYLDFKKVGEIKDGWLDLTEVHIRGSKTNIQGDGKVHVSNLDSRYVNADNLAIEFTSDNNNLTVKKFKLIDGDGSLELVEKTIFYSYKEKKFLPKDVDVVAKNLDLNNALSYIQKQLYPLSGKIFGPVKFKFNKPNFSFHTSKDTSIKNLKLQFGKTKILEIAETKLVDSEFKVENYMFSMKATLEFDRNRIPIIGEVKSDGVYFSALDSVIDLEKLGKIVNLDIRGRGELDVIVAGPFKDTKLIINGDILNAQFEKIKLGDLELEKTIHLSKQFLEFKKIVGIVNKSDYSLHGTIRYDKFDMNLTGNIPNITYFNLYSIFKEFVPGVDLYQDYILGPMSLNFDIKNNEKSFYVDGTVLGNNLFFINESVNKLKSKFYIDSKSFNLNDIFINKGSGFIKGKVGIDFKNANKDISFKFGKIKLTDFNMFKTLPMRLTGILGGDLELGFTDTLKTLDLKVDLIGSKIGKMSVPNSYLRSGYKDKKLDVRGKVMNDVEFKTNINFRKNKKSFAFIDVNISDVSKFLMAYLGLDSSTNQINGKLVGDLNTSFYYNRLENLDLSASLKEFYLRKDDVYINLDLAKTVIVKNGLIKEWDITIPGENALFVSKATGNFSNKFSVVAKADYSASLIEILSNKIVESKGKILNLFKLDDQGHLFETGSKDLYLDIEGLPTYITDAKYKFIFKDYKFIVENFTAKLKEGLVRLRGDFTPKFPYPEVNFTFELDKSKFYIFKNSNIIVSASGTLYGIKPPYRVNASVIQEGGEIFDEINEMAGEDISTSLTRNKYLPRVSRSTGTGLFDINASLISNAPVWVKNSMVDLKLLGNLEVKGSIDDPKILGEYKILPIVSKVTMKNNDFKVKKGAIVFDGVSDYKDPKLNILSETAIDKYNVSLRAFGKVSNLALDLSSDPYLNTSDILSLIALGYTDKVSQQLNDGQQQSLSTIGIGAVLFDQLKFNDSLKKNFGVQVNLGTEVQEDINSSLIDGRGGSSGDTGRFRSATKIEVKKKLNDMMDIAVSSTVGGDIGQQQRMNFNVNLKKDLSLEMIYENRTNLEDDRATDANSFGVDVRFKQDFK